jgi:hypothetical protein
MKRIDIIQHLVDISELGLDYLKKESDHIRIGAATPINAIGASPPFFIRPLWGIVGRGRRSLHHDHQKQGNRGRQSVQCFSLRGSCIAFVGN